MGIPLWMDDYDSFLRGSAGFLAFNVSHSPASSIHKETKKTIGQ